MDTGMVRIQNMRSCLCSKDGNCLLTIMDMLEVLLWISNAFDSINYELLIAKLHAYGFIMPAGKLVYSYLNNYLKLNKSKCHLMSGHKLENIWVNVGNTKIWERNFETILKEILSLSSM